MSIQITVITSDYRGDHAADVRIAHEVDMDETVRDLVKRTLIRENGHPKYEDHIEIRLIRPKDSEV